MGVTESGISLARPCHACASAAQPIPSTTRKAAPTAPGTRLEIRAELVAGRDPHNAISIPADGYASGRHARFLRGDQSDIVEDLKSTNGTYVNGQRLGGAQPLRPGDVVTIGQTQLTYEAPR